MDTILVALRVVHVVGGIFWVGSATMMTFFLYPAVVGAGPAAGPVMAGLQRRGFMTALPVIALLTMLSGFAMVWRLSGGDFGAYARSPGGSVFTMAGGIGVLGFLVGMFLARPAAMRTGEITRQLAGNPDDATRAALMVQLAEVQRRGTIGSIVSTALLLAAAVGMAVARYV